MGWSSVLGELQGWIYYQDAVTAWLLRKFVRVTIRNLSRVTIRIEEVVL